MWRYLIGNGVSRYLMEDQLKGPSNKDGYIRALQKGCRCVECKFFPALFLSPLFLYFADIQWMQKLSPLCKEVGAI